MYTVLSANFASLFIAALQCAITIMAMFSLIQNGVSIHMRHHEVTLKGEKCIRTSHNGYNHHNATEVMG